MIDFSQARRASQIGLSRFRRPDPSVLVVRSATLCQLNDKGIDIPLVHSLGEFRELLPDAHPDDLETVIQAFRRDPKLVIDCFPGR